MQTGTFTAEVGRASSGGINVITRSGGNDFHGALFHFIRNDKMDARTFFAARRDPLRQNQFGGSLGGPIVWNKLFFFGSYEGARRRIGYRWLRCHPKCQRQGVGSALVHQGLELCRERGKSIVVVVWHPGYYPRSKI